MPQTPTSGALVVAEKIGQTLDNSIHPIIGRITASFGVAEKMKSESFHSLYKRVDKALYCAKEGGRNCVVSSDNEESFPVALVHIEWKNRWESGNKEIDEQHKELIDIANTLIYMSFSGKVAEKITHQLDILLKHIIEHFDYEEKVLINIGYPNHEQHSKIHKDLVTKALKLKEYIRMENLIHRHSFHL